MTGFKKIIVISKSWKFHALFWSSFGVIALTVRFSVPELLYEGVSFSTLIDAPAPTDFYKARTATEALGAKAVPILIQVLEEPTEYQKLSAKIYPKLPPKIAKAVPVPKIDNMRRARAAALLMAAKSNSIPAIPALIRVAENDPHHGARWNALCTLATIAPNTQFEERSLEAVIKGTTDADNYIRLNSFALIGNFTNYPIKALPIILQGLKSSETREMSSRALRKLGTNEDLAHMTNEEFERDLRLRRLNAD